MNDKRIKIITDMLETSWSLKQTMEVQKVSAMDLVELKICDLLRLELKTNWIEKMKESFLVKYESIDMRDLGVYQLTYDKTNKNVFYYNDGQSIEEVKPNEVFEMLFKVERQFTIDKILGEIK
jgi:hypothetical protein